MMYILSAYIGTPTTGMQECLPARKTIQQQCHYCNYSRLPATTEQNFTDARKKKDKVLKVVILTQQLWLGS